MKKILKSIFYIVMGVLFFPFIIAIDRPSCKGDQYEEIDERG